MISIASMIVIKLVRMANHEQQPCGVEDAAVAIAAVADGGGDELLPATVEAVAVVATCPAIST